MGAREIDIDRLLGTDEGMTVRGVRLEKVESKTNTSKFYEVRVEKSFDRENPYRCVAYYGRIGARTAREDVKYEGDMVSSAEVTMDRVLREKRKKGYKDVK